MLSRAEMLTMLVGLKEVNDLDLVEGDSVLNVSCTESDKSTVRAMASLIDQIYDDFDYEVSPEFLDKTGGK